MGGQTEFPIEDVSVDEGMKNAFKKIDVYLGAMTGVYAGVIDARLWVLVPNIVETNFRRGGGWDVETKWFGRLHEWDWSEKGVEPVVQSMPSEDSGEAVPMLLAAEPVALAASGENSTTITVNAGTDETPYILLAFDKNKLCLLQRVVKPPRSKSTGWVIATKSIPATPSTQTPTSYITRRTTRTTAWRSCG